VTTVSSSSTGSARDGRIGWRIVARGLAGIHLAYVFFVVLGAVLVLVWPALIWAHLLAVAWAIATMSLDLGCPLTPWEKQAWRRGGRTPYEEGFLQHHFFRARVSRAASRRHHVKLSVAVLILNLVLYALIFRAR